MNLILQIAVAVGVSLACFAGVMLAFRLFSPAPAGLGGLSGLLPCADKPNSVSSSDPRPSHHVAPLECPADEEQACAMVESLMASYPRTVLVKRDGPYFHFECRSLIFRFVDDVEFLVDAGHGLVEIRSASRAGHSDLGVNRARVERLRGMWQAMIKAKGPA
jgi:uncharacterized protein (DUF1499 family)